MEKLDPSMRLKVKRDTFYLSEPNRGVYLRNNSCSFRLEGIGIDQWVEKLLPMFNGEYSLEKLTDGLPGPYRERVFQIAEVLLENGFVRDAAKDDSHTLSEEVMKKFASQIEFVDNLAGSGAARFQKFRDSNVLAVGSGPMLNSLVSSLLESGLKELNVMITSEVHTNRKRLAELVAHAHKTDSEVAYQELQVKEENWRELRSSFDHILYVSQGGNQEELKMWQNICRDEKKTFLPAIILKNKGLAGPIFNPGSEVCWESAWRRLHSAVFEQEQGVPSASLTTGALLANVVTFELFKDLAGVTKAEQKNRIFLLDLETLEGSWHSFFPHPLETRVSTLEKIETLEFRLGENQSTAETERLFQYFSLLTSKGTGILHVWEEADLKQLPLAQCRVQAANPLSEGPAELLESRVCSGFTHEEARIEAALSGIEDYAARMAGLLHNEEFMGVGAGETFAEAVGRGLQKCLSEKLNNRRDGQKELISLVDVEQLEDNRCRFYITALSTMQGAPRVGIGKDINGFPVFWVGTSKGWYGNTDLNGTMAFRNALQNALYDFQNDVNGDCLQDSEVQLEEWQKQTITIHDCPERIQTETMYAALDVLKENGTGLSVFDLRIDPIFNQQLNGLVGVLLREEGVN
ncbi:MULTISPECIES: putative thiazole-containing bacteriocin maturation protein [unclassified Mesobacillus]|uniref:putative thiazole-containing bacteriocin maturation protein n=1 Tax=unclassified Mesobacillus TaxID=2675270 RepID=UPI00203D8C01|nr:MULTISPECIES: putative thiazole-containing bacteriocin maturation protein [unclassified Mesobacillus]MCM3122998.1 putative thiazole-containing bacteriocin maturation protein [Mesobacillus sp. MER 33]MCM3233519.1 putative thiazole-containing bacteriocin maturation protein [Mesobacillus sp. MER 48]